LLVRVIKLAVRIQPTFRYRRCLLSTNSRDLGCWAVRDRSPAAMNVGLWTKWTRISAIPESFEDVSREVLRANMEPYKRPFLEYLLPRIRAQSIRAVYRTVIELR
jgi:hypothetical protein